MNYTEWKEAELQELRENMRVMGFTPEFIDHWTVMVGELMDVAHDMEFENGSD